MTTASSKSKGAHSAQGNTDTKVEMLKTPQGGDTNVPVGLNQGLRGLRLLTGRDPDNGSGQAKISSDIALPAMLVGFTIIDALSGEQEPPESSSVEAASDSHQTHDSEQLQRWTNLFGHFSYDEDDTRTFHSLYESIQHGFGLPNKVAGRTVVLINEDNGYAIDTSHDGKAIISVPAFLNYVVEEFSTQHAKDWDNSVTDNSIRL